MPVHLPPPALYSQLAAGGGGQPAWAGTIAILGVVALPFLQSAAKPALRRVFKPTKCKLCYGTGTTLCSTCKGRGKEGGLISSQSLRQCTACFGKGKQLCSKCRGAGIDNRWLYAGRRVSEPKL
eukprot:TRINITY_DN9562_c0_g1_i1.p1 TRINITY_DN9562_c0_g1~~TRINITY_DN9562_c0_g1_i1.p1  ORF type:complete len:124 (-),score=7.41 TRINITY_DN9562_c0_g1_i1:360-731(-)